MAGSIYSLQSQTVMGADPVTQYTEKAPWIFQRELCNSETQGLAIPENNSQEPSEGSSGTRLQLKCDFPTPGACSVAPCGRGIVKSQRQELASGHLWGLMGVLLSLPTSEWG